MYFAHERRTYILRLLEERGHLRAVATARELGVTDETVRNDLIALEKKGLLKRVHGGAVYVMPTAAVNGHESLGVLWAQDLASSIALHARLFIEYSPQSMALVARLVQTPCTIIGNHPRLLAALQPASVLPECVSTGGYFDKRAGVFAGKEALATVLRLSPDLLVLAPDTFSAATGCGYRHEAQAAMARSLAENISDVAVLCPASRLNGDSPTVTGPLPVRRLFTEDSVGQEERRYLQHRGIELMLAPAAPLLGSENAW